MIRDVLGTVMARRAERLADWLLPYLPPQGPVLDIGSGTGHNVAALQRRRGGVFINLDVANLHVVGERPVRFDGVHMPFADDSFAAALLLFVLHYSPDPVQLLAEARRVCRGPVLVLQSVHRGLLAEVALRLYDLAWGPAAFAVARAAKMVAPGNAPLYARVLASPPLLNSLFTQSGLRSRLVRTERWPLLAVRRELHVLEPVPPRRADP
jgi:SAM-dependent methyltransferase